MECGRLPCRDIGTYMKIGQKQKGEEKK